MTCVQGPAVPWLRSLLRDMIASTTGLTVDSSSICFALDVFIGCYHPKQDLVV